MSNFLDKPIPDVPTPKTVKGWVVFISLCTAAVLLMTWGFVSINNHLTETREKQEAEVTALMFGYANDGVNFDHGKSNGSMPGNVTLNIAKDGAVYSCRNISMDTLRQHAPINCEGGTTITAR